MSDNQARRVKTTATSIRIAHEIKRRDGATLAELAESMDLAKSTIHNHLATLVDERLLVVDAGVYRIGLGFLEFGSHARTRHTSYRPGRAQAHRLAESINEEANFSVTENGFMYPLEYVMGESSPDSPAVGSEFLKVGERFYMHSCSSGKAVLAALPDDEVDRVVERHGLPAVTENTITDRETLFDELDGIRERGYATNDEELQSGFRSIAASVTHPDGTVIGGLAIGGPAYRFELSEAYLDRYVALLEDAAETVEAEIAQLDRPPRGSSPPTNE